MVKWEYCTQLGWALFDTDGRFVIHGRSWNYLSRVAVMKGIPFEYIHGIWFDRESEELFIQCKNRKYPSKGINEFWCMTHQYWMGVVRRELC